MTVRFGETLGVIARDYGVSLYDLQALNEIWSWVIYVGQELEIPAGGTAPAAPEETASPDDSPTPVEPSAPIESSGMTHKVRFGETLGAIARDYGVSLNDLQALNDIWTWTIYVGQELEIPAGGAPPEAPIFKRSRPRQFKRRSSQPPPLLTRGQGRPARIPSSPAKTCSASPSDTACRWMPSRAQMASPMSRGFIQVWFCASATLTASSPRQRRQTPTRLRRQAQRARRRFLNRFLMAAAQQYTVQPGDFLSRIGAKFGMNWLAIVELNGIVNPDNLSAGTVLHIPTAAGSGQIRARRVHQLQPIPFVERPSRRKDRRGQRDRGGPQHTNRIRL